MGFSVKIAPGVRIRASSRGMRVGVGPRIARVHVGTGRPGVSSGVGPFSVYTSVGGKRRAQATRSGAKRPPSPATLQRQAAAARHAQAEADKAREAQRLAATFHEILDLHRHEFQPVQRPIAPLPQLPDAALIRDWHEKNALRGVSRFDRKGRAQAREDAMRAAQAELNDIWQRAQARQAEAQAELDAQWARLAGNDPDTVLATLSEAFEDNEAAAAPIGVDRDEVALTVLVPGDDAVPERMPAKTQAGNLTLRLLPKGERSALYLLLVAGHVLATLRETFAVAPGINAARVVAVRAGADDVYGRPGPLECMAAGHWTRASLGNVRWQDADATNILVQTAGQLVLNATRGQIVPIDLSREPEIATLLASIDTTELHTGH
jgi:hypothetical protein